MTAKTLQHDPLVHARRTDDPATGAMDGAAGRRLTGVPILVVEDDPASARFVLAVLAIEGADEVHLARSAEDALAVLDRVPIRVVLLDLVLPRMSGFDLVRRIASEPSWHDVVLIAVSGLDGPDAPHEAVESGCAAFIRKPFVSDDLVAAIEGCMDGSSPVPVPARGRHREDAI